MSKKNQVNCPKCPMKVYIRKRRDSDQYFITDTKDRKAECHRNTCASGEFIDSDILNSYRSNEKIDLRNEYRGIFGQLQMWTDVVSLATKFNQYYSHLLNGKKMFIVKYTNENYIRYKTRFTHIPKDYYKTDFIPIIVESYLGESLIWVCTNKYHSDDDSSISNREKLNYYGLKYNKFYLFDRKINISKVIDSEYVYELSSNEITDDNALNHIYELLANGMNSEVVNTLMYNRHALMSLRITGMRELQNILDLKKYIGEKGEEYVLNYEINELKKLGLSKYSKLVDQISKNNVAAGYDIISYTKEGCKKFIEVKTSLNSSVYCYMSLNEWNTAKKLGDNYYLYVVVLKPEAVIVKIINNPVFEENKLFVKEANSYKIKFKGL